MSMFRVSRAVCCTLPLQAWRTPAAATLAIATCHPFSTRGMSVEHADASITQTQMCPKTPSSSFASSFGMAIWARVAALATKSNPSPSPVAVDIGSGQHAETLAQLGMHVIGNPFMPQASPASSVLGSMHNPPAVDLVLAASVARKDIVPCLMQAFSLLKNDGHLVACWNDRDLGHPTTKALLKARHASTSATSAMQAPTSSSPSPLPHPPSTHAASPVRGVSTHARVLGQASGEGGCDAATAFPQAGHLIEEQHEYNATRHLLEDVVGPNGRSLFRVVSFSILPNPLPLPAPLPASLSGFAPPDATSPAVLPYETKMFILRKAC